MASSSESNKPDECFKQSQAEESKLLDHDKIENNNVKNNENNDNLKISSLDIVDDLFQDNVSSESNKPDECFKQSQAEESKLLDHDKIENNNVKNNENNDNLKISSLDIVDDLFQDNVSFIGRPGSSNVNSFDSSIGMTPLKDNSHDITFKRGVMCSSTPIHEPPAKKHKFDPGNLTTIEESNSSKEEDSNIAIIDNDFKNNEKENELRLSYPVDDNYFECNHTACEKSKVDVDCPNISSNEQESANVTIIENVLPKDGEEPKSFYDEDGVNPSKSFDDKDSEDCCNETVLHKDEVSLMIDNLVNGLEKTTEGNSILENNNLTINVNRDLSVTYRNIEEKTIDDAILAEKISSTKVNDIIKLEFEPDQEKIIAKANNLQVFVSNDEEENKDNYDPEWEVFQKLQTDDERYKVVRMTWKNLTIPDPKENLSSFNWRNKNSLGPLKNIDLPKTLFEDKKKSNICYPCTEVFDVAYHKMLDFYERRCRGMNVDHNYEHDLLTSLKNLPKYAQTVNSNNDCISSLDQLYSCLKERLHRYKNAKEEIEAIHKFYNGLKNREENSSNLLKLKHCERQEVLDVENMINTYSNWYKN